MAPPEIGARTGSAGGNSRFMMFDKPPKTVCILRLSALGDACNVLPVVRTLQQAWPQTRFTWVIGGTEASLLGLIPEIEFIIFDKRGGLRGLAGFRRAMRGRRFDLLLHMQTALRSSVVSTYVPARVKLGFDRARARDLQWLFTSHRIEARPGEHSLDSLFGFAEALGVHDRILRWDIPLPESALEYARSIVEQNRKVLVISPCSSHPRRNWRPEHYARVADHATRLHGMRVVLTGGRSAIEQDMGRAIEAAAQQPLINAIGRDTLPQMMALLQRAAVLISPDSGPVHMATAVGTPVIGLYAATNPERTGPYFSRSSCVNRYAEAARQFLRKTPEQLPWMTKIEKPGVMDLIRPEDVIAKLDGALRQKRKRSLQLT
jgi:heptosyltransferase I